MTRDSTLRATAEGRGGGTPVSDVKTTDINWCAAQGNTQDVLQRMGEARDRRIPLVDQYRNRVGIVALGDLAVEDEETSMRLSGTSRCPRKTPPFDAGMQTGGHRAARFA